MNKKVIGLMGDELKRKIITQIVALRLKAYSYLTDDEGMLKKAKGAETCVIKELFKFNSYKNCLFKNDI